MNRPNLIEQLESRTFLAAHPAAAAVIGATSGVVASATNAPNISVAQTALYFNAVKGNSNSQILRIINQGTANLDFKAGGIFLAGPNRGNFTIDNFPAGGLSLKPGRRLDLSVTFNTPSNDSLGVKFARLNIISTDPKRPGITVALRALTTAGTHDDLEPSLQRVIDTFGLPIDVGDSNPDDYLLGTPTASSDEVTVQSLVKAGPGAVSIRPVAMFGVNSGPAVRLGIYTPGQIESLRELWYVPAESAQSVSPIVYGQTKVDPGTNPFALYTQWPGFYNDNGTARNVYSEDQLNGTWEPNGSKTRKMRFYPFVDQFGNAAPNTYLVAVEEFTQAYDNQDVLFIISNVKPADAKPTLAATSKIDIPSNNRLIFNRIENPDPDYPNVVRSQNTVVVRNTGTQNLVVNFAKTGNFSIVSGGGTDVSIAPGTSRNVVISFTATSGTQHNGTFTITSNDPDNPTQTFDLVGWWQQYSEFQPDNHGISTEPTAKTIVNNIFGFTTNITNSGQQLNAGGNIQLVGDEILSPYWKVADDGAYVRVTQLASFHSNTFLDANMVPQPTQSYIAWYAQGDSGNLHKLPAHGKGNSQTFFPLEGNSSSLITSGAFKPGSGAFGFNVEGHEFSDPTLNDPTPGKGHFVRFWPAYDAEGKLIPNTYIILHDYNREFTNFDYNDNIYLVENIKPVNAVKSVLTVFTEETSKGARISFTSPATGPRIAGFNVYRSTTARGGYALLTDTPLARRPVTTYIDESVTPDQTFYYQITSVGDDGAESQPVTVKI
jgi:hypothetical protein